MTQYERVYVIAEAGVNHNGERDKAFALVDAAVSAGADAVKFQTFSAKKLASRSVGKAKYQVAKTGVEQSQFEMLSALELSTEMHRDLQSYAHSKGIEFLSTAFDLDSLHLLVGLGLSRLKVPSGELVNAHLLWHYGRTELPLIMSTGMATLSEVEAGLAILAHAVSNDTPPASQDECWREWADPANRLVLKSRVALLHCTSNYPTPFSEVNLLAMETLRRSFGFETGYSDHTEGTMIPIAAVAQGARVIEKHFTLDRSLPGPDHAASLEPDELALMVRNIRDLELAFGDPTKAPQLSEIDIKRVARQQIVAATNIKAGDMLTEQNMTTSRTGGGIPASEFWDVVGSRAVKDFATAEKITR